MHTLWCSGSEGAEIKWVVLCGASRCDMDLADLKLVKSAGME